MWTFPFVLYWFGIGSKYCSSSSTRSGLLHCCFKHLLHSLRHSSKTNQNIWKLNRLSHHQRCFYIKVSHRYANSLKQWRTRTVLQSSVTLTMHAFFISFYNNILILMYIVRKYIRIFLSNTRYVSVTSYWTGQQKSLVVICVVTCVYGIINCLQYIT